MERVIAVYPTQIVTDGGIRYVLGNHSINVGQMVHVEGQYVFVGNEPRTCRPPMVESDKVVISVDGDSFNVINIKKNELTASYRPPAWYEYPNAYNYVFIYKETGQCAVIAYGDGFINVRSFINGEKIGEYTLQIPSVINKGIKCEAYYDSDGEIVIGVFLIKSNPYLCKFMFFKGQQTTEVIDYANILQTFFTEQKSLLLSEMNIAYNNVRYEMVDGPHTYSYTEADQVAGILYDDGITSCSLSNPPQTDLCEIDYLFKVNLWDKSCIIFIKYTYGTYFSFHCTARQINQNGEHIYNDLRGPYGPNGGSVAYVNALIKIVSGNISVVQRSICYPYIIDTRTTAVSHTGKWVWHETYGPVFVGSLTKATYKSFPAFNGVKYDNYNIFYYPKDIKYETVDYSMSYTFPKEIDYTVKTTNGHNSYILASKDDYYGWQNFMLRPDFPNNITSIKIENNDFNIDVTSLGVPVALKKINSKTLLYAGEKYNRDYSTYTLNLIDIATKTVITLLSWTSNRNFSKYFDVIKTRDKCKQMLS